VAGPFGRSWLVDTLNLGTMGGVGGGLLWLGAGVLMRMSRSPWNFGEGLRG
jgi:hypothetical protein